MNYDEYLKQQRKRNKEICKKRKAGKTLQEIGNEYGLTKQRIQAICKRGGS